jgi:hypothetical protein
VLVIITGLVLLAVAAAFGLDLVWEKPLHDTQPGPVRADAGHQQCCRARSQARDAGQTQEPAKAPAEEARMSQG